MLGGGLPPTPVAHGSWRQWAPSFRTQGPCGQQCRRQASAKLFTLHFSEALKAQLYKQDCCPGPALLSDSLGSPLQGPEALWDVLSRGVTTKTGFSPLISLTVSAQQCPRIKDGVAGRVQGLKGEYHEVRHLKPFQGKTFPGVSAPGLHRHCFARCSGRSHRKLIPTPFASSTRSMAPPCGHCACSTGPSSHST